MFMCAAFLLPFYLCNLYELMLLYSLCESTNQVKHTNTYALEYAICRYNICSAAAAAVVSSITNIIGDDSVLRS